MMTHRETENRLNDYVDGLLPEEEGREVERHLNACETCREEAAFLRSLLTAAAALPGSIRPKRDLWTDIAAGIDGRNIVSVEFGGRSAWFRRGMLAAAAVVLIALSSALTAFWLRARSDSPVATAPDGHSGGNVIPAVRAELEPFETTYSRAIEELTTTLRERRHTLAPETVEVIEKNLGIIDEAIRTSREALATDPDNQELLRSVSAMYEVKVNLLHRAAELPAGS